ncbi:MAG: PKD domain-containing protein [Bacteroidales bacterium]|nr:PKD domain-containing protein [Bacteroidales bacterium]
MTLRGHRRKLLHHHGKSRPAGCVSLPEPAFTWQSFPCDSAVHVNETTTTAGVITQWIWHWGDGSDPDTLLQGENPDISHVYEQAGSCEVTLEVQNSNGCVDMFSQEVYREPCGGGRESRYKAIRCATAMSWSLPTARRYRVLLNHGRRTSAMGTTVEPQHFISRESLTHSRILGAYEVTLTVRAMY